MTAEIIHGDCLDVMRGMDDASVDAVVTDPPYELGFMGKAWDRSGIANNADMWREVLRVLKPGGHLVSFGGTRTAHRMTSAIEDAGFEIRDTICWLYGQGFPKSLDVSKAIDKAAGAEREVVGTKKGTTAADGSGVMPGKATGVKQTGVLVDITAPATDLARQWSGWGTALKPAHEPATLARKPLIGTVAANVTKHGTGAINIGGTRIEASGRPHIQSDSRRSVHAFGDGLNGSKAIGVTDLGRWPANVCLDEEAAAMLDEQSEGTRASKPSLSGNRGTNNGGYDGGHRNNAEPCQFYSDTGGASRFFYCAKASKAERGVGNIHPTVKPLALMRWLCRLITPPGGLVLDPFAGSGTTIAAAIAEGFRGVGIERESAYVDIARARIANAQKAA